MFRRSQEKFSSSKPYLFPTVQTRSHLQAPFPRVAFYDALKDLEKSALLNSSLLRRLPLGLKQIDLHLQTNRRGRVNKHSFQHLKS